MRRRKRNIKAHLRQFKENEKLRAALRLFLYAVVTALPFCLLIRANASWTPYPRFFPDDAFYARLCLPDGLLLYWHDFGLYRILPVLPYALVNRFVMRAYISPALLSLTALAIATIIFVWACLRAELSKRRGALLAGVLLSSPLLLETLNFWSGTLNHALVLLLVAAQLGASVWARRVEDAPSRGLIVTACGALLALLTYEIALPFILATSALYVRGTMRRILTVGLACVVLAAIVAALAAAGWYWPARFKLLTEQLAAAAVVTTNTTTTTAGSPAPDAPAAMSAVERAGMYGSLLFSFIRTGLRSPWFWVMVGSLAGLSFLSRPGSARTGEDERLPKNLLAAGFAFALVACVVYLSATNSMNARYVAFLLLYGAASLAWAKSRAAGFALASLLLLQVAVAASLPVHLRDVESAAKGAATASFREGSDVISVNGRLARASWGRRFLEPQQIDLLQQPLSPRACRYSVPCEECK